MAGKHRRRPARWRRVLQATAAGSAAAMLGTAVVTAKQQAVVPAESRPETTVTVPAIPAVPITEPWDAVTDAQAAINTVTAVRPKPTIVPTTVSPPKRHLTIYDELNAQPTSSAWGVATGRIAQVGHLIQTKFDVSTIYGRGPRGNASDHPTGYALDFMATGSYGDLIAQYILDHLVEFDVKYVIWKQRINEGHGWKPMEDRGGDTANHFDHVHVSFNS